MMVVVSGWEGLWAGRGLADGLGVGELCRRGGGGGYGAPGRREEGGEAGLEGGALRGVGGV